MGYLEIALIGAGLAMDAVAVSMTNGLVYKNLRMTDYIAMPVLFAFFQMAMPLIGFFAGGFFADIIMKYSGIVILLILGIIGGKMLKEGIAHMRSCEVPKIRIMRPSVLFSQAIATSIDAFAVGIGFSVVQVRILPAVMIIGVITAVLVVAAILIGRKFQALLGNKAEILGGIILIMIGIKAVL